MRDIFQRKVDGGDHFHPFREGDGHRPWPRPDLKHLCGPIEKAGEDLGGFSPVLVFAFLDSF